MLGLSAPSDKAANRLAERKRKDKLNGGIALITGQGNQSQTYIEGKKDDTRHSKTDRDPHAVRGRGRRAEP